MRAGTSASTIGRLERGDTGFGIGTLGDVLVVFGLVERLGDLVDIRKDDLGLALDTKRLPQRGRSSAKTGRKALSNMRGDLDPEGMAF